MTDSRLSNKAKSMNVTARSRLLQLQEELEAIASINAQSSDTVELDQAKVGRLSRMDAMQAQAMSQASGRRRELMLKKIAAALARIESDEYGFCQSCDELIAEKRLEIDPTALLCIDCAEKAERRSN